MTAARRSMGLGNTMLFSTGTWGARKTRNAGSKQERDLVVRHRWFAGGVATVLSAALIFSGVTPAMAEDPTPPPPATTVEETTPPVDETPVEDVVTPVEQPAPVE